VFWVRRGVANMTTNYALRRAVSAFSFPNHGVSNPGPRGFGRAPTP
jgi:hypothetical protein